MTLNKCMSIKEAHDYLTGPHGMFPIEDTITNGVKCKTFRGHFKTLQSMWLSTEVRSAVSLVSLPTPMPVPVS